MGNISQGSRGAANRDEERGRKDIMSGFHGVKSKDVRCGGFPVMDS